MAVAAFVIAVPLVYYLLFERGLSVTEPKEIIPQAIDGGTATEPVVEPDEPESIVPSALSLTETEGNVEIGRAGRDWQPAEIGTVLNARDRIRTDPTARAVLAMPGVFSVALDSSSEFEVRILTEKVSRFLLEDGMISADVVDNPEKLFEVEADDSLARTKGGSFKMSKDKHEHGVAKKIIHVESTGIKTVEAKSQNDSPGYGYSYSSSTKTTYERDATIVTYACKDCPENILYQEEFKGHLT